MKNLLLILFLFVANIVFADFPKMKFGKISKEDMTMEVYPLDSSAHAVVLGDYGRSDFDYDGTLGWRIKFERHVRIKIFDKEGFSYANFEIPIYRSGSTREKIYGIKGVVYNLEDGKIVKTKLGNENSFTEEVSKYKSIKKLSLPNIKEGSVIDLKYSIESEFIWELREWQFQYGIPVKYSMYDVEIPEYFTYSIRSKGYHPLAINEERNQQSSISYSVSGATGPSNKYSVDFMSEFHRYGMENIPAFKAEPYMTTSSNFISMVEFELATTKMPGQGIKVYTKAWSSINYELLSSYGFGQQISASHDMKDAIANITNGTDDNAIKAAAILSMVQNRMNWNNRYGVTTEKGTKKAYKEQRGNVADINLLLVSLLREAGINAFPVVLSTRNHGLIHPSHPTISQFNYVIAAAKINDSFIFMDGTAPLCPAGVLPYRCLNGRGRIIDENFGDWISLQSDYKWDNSCMISLSFNENMELSGSITEKLKGYAAIARRSSLRKKGEDKFLENFIADHPGIEVDEFNIEQKDSIYKPLTSKLKIDLANWADIAGDKIYLNPMIINQTKSNPFKLEKREFPVDFAYKQYETFILNLEVPQGYTVEELPKPKNIALPNNAGMLKYSVMALGNKIMVQQTLKINKTIFNSIEYQSLKMFYDEIVASQKQQIVLKKS